MVSERHFEVHIRHHKSSKAQYILAINLSNTIRTILILDLRFKTILCLTYKQLFKTRSSSPFLPFKFNSVSLPLIARELKYSMYRDL